MVSKPKKSQRTDATKGQRTGRPKGPDSDRRSALVRVLTTKAEHEELKKAAAAALMSVSNWLRTVGLQRARAVAAEEAATRDREK